jgi:signal transduction histidine kinase
VSHHGEHQQPASILSHPSSRLRALAALSGSLTDALSPADAASLVEQKALRVLGAASALVTTIGAFPAGATRVEDMPTPDGMRILHAMGLPDDVLRTLRHLPPDARVPFAEVAHHGEPLYLHSEREIAGFPEWGKVMLAAGARAIAVVPVWANGELRGVLGLSWSSAQEFGEDECAFIVTLGVMCAQAIMRAYLRAAEKDARVVAEDANESKSRFLTMISHELRTPMNALLGYAQLMADGIDGPITDAQRDHLARVRASGDHLLGLVEELLRFARLEAGRDPVHIERGDLSELVAQAVDLVRPLAAMRGIGIRVTGIDHTIELHTDPQKLRQIFVNLLGNAIKFTDIGAVTVAARVERCAVPQVVVEITDTGPGISAEDQAHVFEAYWQVAPRSMKGLGGTGLGLPYARQLARKLGGDVTITRSEVGIGTTFDVTIPMRHAVSG